MRKRIAAVVVGVTLFAVPAAAEGASSLKAIEKTNEAYEETYLRLYDRYADKFGHSEAGRNWVRDGYREQDGDVRAATKAEVQKASARMDGALNPAPVVTETTETTTTTTSYSSGTSSSTVACESGGDYAANTGNGFYGGYQFDSGTWDAYGDSSYSEASDAPPAVQDAAAASVPYDAWPSCP